MTFAQLAVGSVGGIVVAFILFGVWVMGMDTYADDTWWLFPPLTFISAMFGIYCLLNLTWRAAVALGLP